MVIDMNVIDGGIIIIGNGFIIMAGLGLIGLIFIVSWFAGSMIQTVLKEYLGISFK
jgi:hypothetical protein